MKDKKQIKKERQQLFVVLANIYEAHKEYDDNHEIGTDENCEICQKFHEVNRILELLEQELEETSVGIINNKSLLKVYSVRSKDGLEYLVYFKSKKAMEEYLQDKGIMIDKVHLLTDEEINNLNINKDMHTITQLKIYLESSDPGIIAEKKNYIPRKVFEVLSTTPEKAIHYNGYNHEEIVKFCSPNECFKTKKKNKIQIQTKHGSISISEGQYLVKNVFNHVHVYDEDEFFYLYNPQTEAAWAPI